MLLADRRMSNGQKLHYLGLMIIAVICSRGTQHNVCGFTAGDIFPTSMARCRLFVLKVSLNTN